MDPEFFEEVLVHHTVDLKLKCSQYEDELTIPYKSADAITTAFDQIKFDRESCCFYSPAEEAYVWQACGGKRNVDTYTEPPKEEKKRSCASCLIY